ncbi:ankyrin repeat domain-containing protein [Streptomyces sp. NPDC020875]|uniref:ankyrin repeat domain-containing protein n=1 Tax=Streptomyces sp. NPDC020875 TaxID=3154898 RepID=UPI0033C5EAEF
MEGDEHLVRAAAAGRDEEIVALLCLGVSPDGQTCQGRGRAALDHALWGGHTAAARLLLEAGADTEAPVGEYRETAPLRLAVEQARAELARLLLEAAAEPNGRV